jgi:hypothetical protein
MRESERKRKKERKKERERERERERASEKERERESERVRERAWCGAGPREETSLHTFFYQSAAEDYWCRGPLDYMSPAMCKCV